MRPFPWTVRVILFAVGFGAGLSQYRAPSTQPPLVIEIHVVKTDVQRAVSEPPTLPSTFPPLQNRI
jgi:hypothetical protein